jgi:hypothetical protein
VSVTFRAPDGSLVTLPGPLDECPYCARDEKCALCLALDEAFTASLWDESKHPRDPGGEGGGQFVEKGSGIRLEGDWSKNPARAQEVQTVADDLAGRYDTSFKRVLVRETEEFEQLAGKSNEAIYVSPRFLDDEFMDDHLRTWKTVSNTSTPADLVAHEFGHILDGELLRRRPDLYDRLNAFLDEPVELGDTGRMIPRVQSGLEAPSAYGSENRYEFVAEGFIDWYRNGEKAHPSSVFVGKLLDEGLARKKPLAAAAWDESKHPRDPGGEHGGEFVEKSQGHLLFADKWEYLVYGDDVLRAPIDNPIRVDVPIRNGARFEFPVSQIESRRARGVYPFAAPIEAPAPATRTMAGGPFATDFPPGELDPEGTVKFWPRTLGHYDGEPYWKATTDVAGNERAFWFVDNRGRPHHEVMRQTLGLPPVWRESDLAGHGSTPDVQKDEDVAHAIVRRHRKDIDDARQMTRALSAAAWEETRHPRHPAGSSEGGEFAPKVGDTFVGKQGFERGPGKVVIEGERPRTPTADVFAHPWVPLEEAVTREGWREENPQYEDVNVADLVPTQDVMSAVRVQEYVQELQQDGNLDELLDSTRIVEGDDGRLYVADGHNRVAAAIETGNPTLRMPVIRPTVVPPTPLRRTNPEGFGPGEFTPEDPDVKFWPRNMGSYSGFIPDAPYGPFWKSLSDPKTGEELAFWFADQNGLPHHDAMQRALGHVPSDRTWFPFSGYGRTGEAAWGVSRMSDEDRKLMSGRTNRAVEIEAGIVMRHRRDINDANAMLPENQAMAAAATVEPEELTAERFNEIVQEETDRLDRYEEPLAAHYERVIRRVGRALAAQFRKVAPEREALAAAAPAEWNPPTVAELLAAIEAVDAAVEKAEKIQAAAFEQIVEGILRRLGISFEVRAILTQAILNTLGARAVEMIEGIRVPVARAIANSYLNGLSVPQTADVILEAVDGLSKRQATMLARNDLIGLANGGSLMSARIVNEKFPEVGLGYKEWLATEDERTRPTHHEASGQRVPLATPFTVGEASLAYPGDASGPDAEVINCRCTLLYYADAKVDAVTAAVDKAAATIRRAIDEAIVEGVELGMTAAFVEEQHPRDPGGEGGGEFIKKDETGVDEGVEQKPGKRLKLREPDGSRKRQTEATIKKNVQMVADDVADFYGGDRKSETFYEPEACASWGVEATTRIPQLDNPMEKQVVYYGEGIMEDARDPDFGVSRYRIIAHEAIHANVSGDRYTHGFYHDYEEASCEVLSINYWNQRGQPFDKRDRVYTDGGWTEEGADSLAHSVVYRNETADLMRRSASRVGWDRPKIIAETLRIVKGDSGVKLDFRDNSDPEFKPPDGVSDDAVGMIRWLIEPPVTGALLASLVWDEALFAAAWEEFKHPRHPKGTHLGGKFSPKDYYYGVAMARENDDPYGKQIGWQAYRMQRGMPGAKFDAAGKRVVGVVREEYADALADAKAGFEAELAADAEGIVQREQELIAHVDELRSQPGQGSRHTRTTTPVKDENGEILRGTRDALQIQADEAGVPLDEYDAWTDTRIKELTSEAAGARVAVRTDSLDSILDDGQFLNVHDPAHNLGDQRRTRSPGYAEARSEMEMRLFGDHPIYGYVSLDDEDMDGSHAKAFGKTKVTLRDGVRPRTTVTYSDSMFIDAGDPNSDVIPRPIDEVDHRAVASWMNLGGVEVPVTYKGQEPRPLPPESALPKAVQEKLDTMRRWGRDEEDIQSEYRSAAADIGYRRWRHGDFIEAQIHGGVFLDDIERVDFPPDEPPSQAMIDKLHALGIPWTVGGPDAA